MLTLYYIPRQGPVTGNAFHRQGYGKFKEKEIPTSVAMRTKEQSSKCCPPDQVGNDMLYPIAESGSGEIVLYQPEGEIRLEVRVENETVWLTQAQMAELFHAT